MRLLPAALLPFLLLSACQTTPPLLQSPSTLPADFPKPALADYTVKAFHFRTAPSGDTMDIKLHYRTFGTPRTNAAGQTTNAVLILHGTGGNGDRFLLPQFAGVLFQPGQLLDINKYYIIIPDDVGHGLSTKPSDGLHMKFPHYGYRDMVDLEHALLTDGLGVNHLRLVMGTSMGGMHSWLWAEMYPDFMDAAMPLASLPEQISGRNRVWRKTIIDAIKNDPEWKNGEYTTQPQSLRTDLAISWFMAENPVRRYHEAPTLKAADAALEKYINDRMKTTDANNEIYALSASEDYDPAPDLGKIKTHLLAINTYDDLINPGDLDILATGIKKVPHGRAITLPESPETHGHQSHTYPVLWQRYLAQLLRESEPHASKPQIP